MTNHTIAAPITSWAELLETDREVLNRAEAVRLLAVDARTIDHAIDDGTIAAVRLARRILIPRRPFLEAFGLPARATGLARPDQARPDQARPDGQGCPGDGGEVGTLRPASRSSSVATKYSASSI